MEHVPPPDPYAELRALNEKAEELFRQGHLEECVEACEEGLKALPQNLSFQFLRGRALMGLDRLGEAEESFGKVRESHPDEPHGYHGLLLIYNQQKLWDKGAQVGLALKEKHPDRPDSMYLLGLALMELSRFEEAEEVFSGIRKFHDDMLYGHLGLAMVYRRRHLWEKCVETSNRALELESGRLDLVILKTISLMKLCRFDEAKELMESFFHRNGMKRIPALSVHSRTLQPCLNEDLLNQYWRVVLLDGEMEQAVSIQQEVMHNIIEGELMNDLYGPYSVLIPFFDNSVLGI